MFDIKRLLRVISELEDYCQINQQIHIFPKKCFELNNCQY